MVLHIFSKPFLASKLRTQYRWFHSSGASYKIVQFLLSDIGEGIREVTLSEWFVKVGDKVAQFDDVCCVESDKASVNITSRYDGVIMKLYHETGGKALVGKPLVDIDTDEADSASSSDEEVVEAKVQQVVESVEPEKPLSLMETISHKALATPAVRRIAMEHKIPLSSVTGSGKAGRILKEDILTYLDSGAIPGSKVPSPATPTVADVIPITGVRKVMFNTMTASNTIPAFHGHELINVTKLVQMKKEVSLEAEKKNIKLTYTPFFMKAMSKTLLEYPELNSTLDSANMNIIMNRSHNIGFAVNAKVGLIVPNVKNVQSLSILDIAKEINRILAKGKEGLFNPVDLKDGNITISNVGMLGGTFGVPLMMPSETAIVAFGRMEKQPVVGNDDKITVAQMLYSSWCADHRVIDGASLLKFINLWKYYIENPSILALDL